MNLKTLLTENEAIYEISRACERSINIIGPQVKDVDRELDIAGCIEKTLYCMLDAGCSAEEISEILDASTINNYDIDEENDYYIDLDYVITNFHPMSIQDTGIHYERPASVYTAHHKLCVLCKHVTIPDEATDDEILDIMHDKFGIDQDSYIVADMLGNGAMLGVQSLINPDSTFILKKNMA